MYHYAGNNPVKYVDPDGLAVTIQCGDKFVVRAQPISEKIIFEKVQSASYSFLGEKIVQFSYWLNGERKIDEPISENFSFLNSISKVIDNHSGILDTISFIGDCDISKSLNKMGKLASITSYIQTGYEILKEVKNVEESALESFCCSYLGIYLMSDSHEKSSQLYIYAKASLANLYKDGAFTLSYDKDGNCINYKISNMKALEELKMILNSIKQEYTE